MAVHTAPVPPEAGAAGGADASRPAGLGPLRRGIREDGLALITLGVIVLLFVAYQLWGTGIAEAHSQAALKRSFNAAVATHQPADSPTVAPAAGTKAAFEIARPRLTPLGNSTTKLHRSMNCARGLAVALGPFETLRPLGAGR